MLTTPHRNWVSRKNTIMAARNIPIPNDKANKQPTPTGSSNKDGRIGVLVMRSTINSGTNDKTKLIVEDITLVNG